MCPQGQDEVAGELPDVGSGAAGEMASCAFIAASSPSTPASDPA
jgi:hypothetical protein